jgi:large subunit ribosomal protein L15
MNVNDAHRGIHKHKKRKRLGRGPGSGQGKTSGKGNKGQRSHAGWSALPVFQGGQMPLVRRIPKRGFNNRFALRIVAINIGQLENAFDNGAEVGLDQLREKGLVRGAFDVVKILGEGELTKKLKVSAHRFSASAKEKIEKAGGEGILLPRKTTVAEKQKQRKLARSQA